MTDITYSRRIRSNNLMYQTEEQIEELLSEINPNAIKVTAELVPCFDNQNPHTCDFSHELGFFLA